MIGALGQDAAFVLPIYKKMKNAGIPKNFALPASFAIGSTLAFDKETSFLLDTDKIKGLKQTINHNEDTPAEELFDKVNGSVMSTNSSPELKVPISIFD